MHSAADENEVDGKILPDAELRALGWVTATPSFENLAIMRIDAQRIAARALGDDERAVLGSIEDGQPVRGFYVERALAHLADELANAYSDHPQTVHEVRPFIPVQKEARPGPPKSDRAFFNLPVYHTHPVGRLRVAADFDNRWREIRDVVASCATAEDVAVARAVVDSAPSDRIERLRWERARRLAAGILIARGVDSEMIQAVLGAVS